MQNLKNSLINNLKGADKIAVVGIGSDLRADDIAGILAAKALEKHQNGKLKVFLGYTAPENVTGEIRKFCPTHVILIDASDLGRKTGDAALFLPEEAGGISFSTHKLPIKVMAKYLTESIKCKVMIIGIQPKSLEFGKPVSKEVRVSAKLVSDLIKKAIIEG